MRIVYIYSTYSERERNEFESIKAKYPQLELVDFNEARKVLPIRETPALIFIREDLQGATQLLDIDETTKEYKFAGIIAEETQKEEREFHGQDSDKLARVIANKVTEGKQQVEDELLLLSDVLV